MRLTEVLSYSAENYLKYLCGLQYNAPVARSRLTKIICTIGPASRSIEKLEELMSEGMSIARLNFSHGTHDYHAETISLVRSAAQCYSKKLTFNSPIAIALDTKGPEIRTGLIEGSATREIDLKKGEAIKLTPNEEFREKGTKEMVYVDYANILKLEVGKRIFLDDGLMSLVVEKVHGDAVHCKIENGGKLGSKKGVNLPGIAVDLPAVSEKDKEDLQFAVQQGVDMIFASFIRNADALSEIRDVLGCEGRDIKIISKIENQQGMDNIDEIIEASDGVMVARGDLGIEIPTEKVFVAQKTIIGRCNRAGKPVICATQMLESMTKSPRPTRAEASDVANAVLDGADCVMLSSETAKGSYPSECVHTMSSICKQAETIVRHKELFGDLVNSGGDYCVDPMEAMVVAVVQASFKIAAAAIVVVTTKGDSAFCVSRYRPRCPILMITDSERTARQALLHRGVVPLIYDVPQISCKDTELASRIEYGIECAMKQSILKCGDSVVILIGPKAESGFQDIIAIEEVV